MKKDSIKTLLIVLACVLYVSNYAICELFFSDDLRNWWFLKCDIYTLVIVLLLLSYSIGQKKLVKFFLSVFTGLAASNFIDKFIFDSTHFETDDFLMIAITLLVSGYEWSKEIKK